MSKISLKCFVLKVNKQMMIVWFLANYFGWWIHIFMNIFCGFLHSSGSDDYFSTLTPQYSIIPFTFLAVIRQTRHSLCWSVRRIVCTTVVRKWRINDHIYSIYRNSADRISNQFRVGGTAKRTGRQRRWDWNERWRDGFNAWNPFSVKDSYGDRSTTSKNIRYFFISLWVMYHPETRHSFIDDQHTLRAFRFSSCGAVAGGSAFRAQNTSDITLGSDAGLQCLFRLVLRLMWCMEVPLVGTIPLRDQRDAVSVGRERPTSPRSSRDNWVIAWLESAGCRYVTYLLEIRRRFSVQIRKCLPVASSATGPPLRHWNSESVESLREIWIGHTVTFPFFMFLAVLLHLCCCI
jgi:hypothetical protein